MAKRVLVADDSVTIQRAFSMVFAGQAVALQPARSVDEAVAAAKQNRPDLVIADAVLGSGTGYDLCAALKGDAQLRAVPVYILASQHVPYDEDRGRRAGASGHFTKPFESQAIIEQVQAALARGAAEPRPMPAAPAPAPRPTTPVATAGDDGDEYGEFTIERSSGGHPVPPAVRTAPPSAPPRPAAPPAAAAHLRPSLIPGVQPGTIPTVRPLSAPSVVAPPPPPARQAAAPATRTIMGLPSVVPSSLAPQARPAAPPAAPSPAPPVIARSQPVVATPAPSLAQVTPAAAAVTSAVAQRVAAIAARGPEYEAIAKLSREVIEQVVWEVVPELAEVIIRQEVDRLANAKR